MRVFKAKNFYDWARDESLTDEALLTAIEEMVQGLIDVNLGGSV
jgi:hypothetical protein